MVLLGMGVEDSGITEVGGVVQPQLTLGRPWASTWLPVICHGRFSVNKRIFVVGFGLYGSIHGPTDYQVNIQVPVPSCLPRLHSGPRPVPTSVEPWPNPRPWSLHYPPWAGGLGLEGSLSALPRPEPPTSLQIIHTDSNTVLGQNDTGFSCDGSASTFRVMFKEPVEVLPNVNYTACATLKVHRWGVGSLRGSLWPILRPPGHSRHSPDVATLAQLGPRPVHTWGIPAWWSLTSLYPISHRAQTPTTAPKACAR